jgi:hypothetical protein
MALMAALKRSAAGGVGLAHGDAGAAAEVLFVVVGRAEERKALALRLLEQAAVDGHRIAHGHVDAAGGQVEVDLVGLAVAHDLAGLEGLGDKTVVDGAALHADALALQALGRGGECGTRLGHQARRRVVVLVAEGHDLASFIRGWPSKR